MRDRIHLTATIPEAFAHQRLDAVCAKLFPAHSRARLQTWIKSGELQINGHSGKASEKVLGSELITIDAAIHRDTSMEPQALDLNIVFEDDQLLVINKPAGLVVHPAAGNRDHTLLNGLLAHFPPSAELPRAGIIHRLDKDTTGLMVVAKTLETHTYLVQEMQARTIQRGYAALVNGILTAGGTVDAPIGRHPHNRLKMAVIWDGKPAVTHYRIRERFSTHTYLEVKLETGRTHQIRVHMSHIQKPIVGDILYGGRAHLPKGCSESTRSLLQSFPRQALHAERLSVVHPASKIEMTWFAEIPADMQQLIDGLRDEDKAREQRLK